MYTLLHTSPILRFQKDLISPGHAWAASALGKQIEEMLEIQDTRYPGRHSSTSKETVYWGIVSACFTPPLHLSELKSVIRSMLSHPDWLLERSLRRICCLYGAMKASTVCMTWTLVSVSVLFWYYTRAILYVNHCMCFLLGLDRACKLAPHKEPWIKSGISKLWRNLLPNLGWHSWDTTGPGFQGQRHRVHQSQSFKMYA